jgi:predicted secreted protein
MGWFSGVVLYCSIWAVVFFMVLPLGIVSQHEAGEVEPGTPASAPTEAMVRRKMAITSAISAVLFAAVWTVITSHLFTLDDIPFLTPPSGGHGYWQSR